MTKRATTSTVTGSLQNQTNTVNSNFTAVNVALDNTLSLDGSTPNAMIADLDLNSNDILNASSVNSSRYYRNGLEMVPSNLSNVAYEEYNQGSTGAVNRTVPDRLRDRASLKDFGALGDGVADDTVAVQAAFDAAAGDGLVLTGPTGDYLITAPIQVGDYTTYRGEGAIFRKAWVSAAANADAMFKNTKYGVASSSINEYNRDIDFDGLRCRNHEITFTGAFISFNWVLNLRLTGLDILQTAPDSWCVHLNGKNIVVADGEIGTTGVTQYSDGLHFEYAENVVVTNMLIDTHDDCIAFHYQRASNSSAGPDIKSKNISVTNCYLRSDIGNSIRIGAGVLASVVAVRANAQYDGITVSNCTMDRRFSVLADASTTRTGTTIALFDNTAVGTKHTNILFSNIYIRDNESDEPLIYIIGNDDITNAAKLSHKHYGRVTFDHIVCEKIGRNQSWINGGGVEDLTVSNSSYVSTASNTSQAVDLRMVNNLTLSNNYVKINSSGQHMIIRDFQRLRILANDFHGSGTEYAALRIDQPNVTSGDSIEVVGNVMRGVVRGVSTISDDSADDVALDTGYIVDNDMGGVSGTKVAANLTYAVGQVQHRGELDSTTVVAALVGQTLGAITSSGIIKTDNTTAATSTTDGSLQTDGGLSVVGAAVIGGTALITGVATHGASIVSDTDSTDDLGTTGVRWANLFVDAITATDTITTAALTSTGTFKLNSGSHPTGTSNVALGNNAGDSWTSGSASAVAIGADSARYNTASQNIAIGVNALKGASDASTGASNVAIGTNAGLAITTSTGSVLGGHNAGQALETGAGNVILGANSAAALVGGSNNVCIGNSVATLLSSGVNNVFLGVNAGDTTTTGSKNVCIGVASAASSATVDNEITLGDSNITSLRCQQTSITGLSDMRDKTDIADLGLGLDYINALRPVEFVWAMRDANSDNSRQGTKEAGFIAQELRSAQDQFDVSWLGTVLDTNPDRLEASPGKLLPIVIKALQEASVKIDELNTRIAVLEGN